MMTAIFIANAVLWSGVIIGLLFLVMRDNRRIHNTIIDLEADLHDDPGDDAPNP